MNQRRSFTPQFKTRIVLEVLTKLKSMAQVCREYDLKEQVVTRWKAEFLERAPSVFAPDQERDQDQTRIADLERLVGRLTARRPADDGARDRKKSLAALGLTRDQKRQVIQMLRATYPITVLCQVLELPRSTQYYQPVVRDEADLRQALEAAAQEFPTYGSRRLTQQVRRAPSRVVAGRTRVRRLMGELGLKRRPKPRICRTTNSQHAFGRYPNLVAERVAAVPDEIWVSDITYIRLHHEFIYLAVVMDVFTRTIRGWNLGRSLGQELTLVALERALCHQWPQIHHSDQGIQYAAPAYIQALRQAGVAISMAAVGEPRENGYAERLMRTIKDEEVALADYADFADALRQIGHFIDDVYRTKRIHSALGYLTPAEFEAAWQQEHGGGTLTPP